MYRDNTKVVSIGDRKIGGGNPILIQSMTNTKTEDVEATVAQILELEAAGCEIVRCTVPTLEAAKVEKREPFYSKASIVFDAEEMMTDQDVYKISQELATRL